jgi:hypothetical protein
MEENKVATSLQLVISPLQKMEAIKFNYEELKAGLEKSLAKYKNVIYTEETIKEAEEDRAKLNNLKKSLNTEKIKIKKEFEVPCKEFENKVKELIELIDQPASEIDKQIKAFEEKTKSKKKEEIKTIYEANIGDYEKLIPLEKIYDSRWENKTYKLKDIEKEIKDIVEKANNDIAVIESLKSEFVFQIKDTYFTALDLGKALVEKERLERQKELLKPKEEIVENVVEEVPSNENITEKSKANDDAVDSIIYAVDMNEAKEEKRVKITFTVECTESQLLALGQYMKDNGIKYGRAE